MLAYSPSSPRQALRTIGAFLLQVLVLTLTASRSSADFIVGPGNVGGDWHDSAFDLIAVDLNAPVTIGPGQHVASLFNYAFSATVVGGSSSTALNGTITPLLLIGGGTTFTPVAIGDTIAYAGATGFLSVPFGGTDTFTLASNTTVYAGLYWHAVSDGLDDRMPVGYVNFTGNDFVVYGGGFGPGANPPVAGSPISGSAEGFFSRTYDFSVAVDAGTPAPEPASVVLAGSGFGLLLLGGYRKSLGKRLVPR